MAHTHRIVICQRCGKTIVQCRCPEGSGKRVEHGTCQSCKDLYEIEDQVQGPGGCRSCE